MSSSLQNTDNELSGNHETPGTWRQGALEEDLIDLLAVVEYLKTNFGYAIDLVVGHSRGSVVAMRWICTSEDGRNISAFVNVSGRYRMHVSTMLFMSSLSFILDRKSLVTSMSFSI